MHKTRECSCSGNGLNVPGIFTPTIDLDGTFSISFRADFALNYGINVPGTFTGTIANRENVGKTSEKLVTKWNAEHPEDRVGYSEN